MMTMEELERTVLSALREFTRVADRVRRVARRRGITIDRATWTAKWYSSPPAPPGLPIEIPTLRYRYYWPSVRWGTIDWFTAVDAEGRLLFMSAWRKDDRWIGRARYLLLDRCGALPHEVLRALRGIDSAARWCYRLLGEEPRSILPEEVWAALEVEGALGVLSEV